MRLTRVAIDGDGRRPAPPDGGARARARRPSAARGRVHRPARRRHPGRVRVGRARRGPGRPGYGRLRGLAVAEDTKLVVRGDLPGSDPALHRVSSQRADLGYERDRLLERLESAARACVRPPMSAGARCAVAGRARRAPRGGSRRRRRLRAGPWAEPVEGRSIRAGHPDPHRRDRPRPAPARSDGARHGAGRVGGR